MQLELSQSTSTEEESEEVLLLLREETGAFCFIADRGTVFKGDFAGTNTGDEFLETLLGMWCSIPEAELLRECDLGVAS